MYIRSLTWVYCICHQVYCICHHLASATTLGCTTLAIKCTAYAIMYFRSLTWVYCICHQVHCISYHVNQEPHLEYCICQQVYCICHHLTSEATLRCTTLAIMCAAEAMMYFRSLTWVYFIFHQVYCISYHVNQEPHLEYCICQQVYCTCHHVHWGIRSCKSGASTGVPHMPSCTSGSSLGCTAFVIKCTAYAII